MFGNISIWQLLILLLIVVLVFGTKRLRSLGSDLGGAIKGFRKGMEEEDGTQETAEQLESADQASAGTEQAPESKQTEASKDS